MNRFLRFCGLLFLGFYAQTSLLAHGIVTQKFHYQICFTQPSTGEITEQRHEFQVPEWLSNDCNNPTDLGSGVPETWNTATPKFFTITVPAGQTATLVFLPTAGANQQLQFIDGNCPPAPLSPQPSLVVCGPNTLKIRVQSTTSANSNFTLTANFTTLNPTITIDEDSGNPDDGEVCQDEAVTLTAGGGTTYQWSNGGPANAVFNPPTNAPGTTTYTVTVTDASGCTATTSTNVVVLPLPVADIDFNEISGNTDDDGKLCEGDDLTLEASPTGAGFTYNWSGPAGFTSTDDEVTIADIAVANAGTYTVTVTDANDCTDTHQVVVEVFENPEGTVTVDENSGLTADDGEVCVDDAFTLEFNFTNGAGVDYDWDFPGGGTGTGNPLNIAAATVAAHDGVFSVTVTDANGCTTTGEITITVNTLPDAQDTELKACELIGTPGSADFVLTDAEEAPGWPGTNQNDGADVDNGATVTVSYHSSQAGAENNTGVVNSGTYTNRTIVYARVLDPATGCFDVAEVLLTAVQLPQVTDTELKACADPNNPSSADFVLTDAELSPGYPGGNQNDGADIDNGNTRDVTYHNSLADAQAGSNEITDDPYTSGNTTLFARVVDPVTECFNYHLSQADAEAGTGAQGDGSFADNTILYARVEDPATGCFAIAEVTLKVLLAPDPVDITFMGETGTVMLCEDEAFTFEVTIGTGNGPYTYEWTLPNNSTSTSYPYSNTAVIANHNGTWVVTVTDANGCTATDDINVMVEEAPENNTCADATALPSIVGNINASGNNECGQPGGSCGGTEATVYYSYTVPQGGITELTAVIDAPFSVTAGNSCGGGDCGNEVTLNCEDHNLDEGAIVYFAVHSTEADAGNFTLSVRTTLMTPKIEGIVYVDLDEDGMFGGSDIGLGSVPMELVDGCPDGAVVATTETADDGTYMFNNGMDLPPGSYTVRIGDGGPEGEPSPKECCLEVTACDQTILECELGFPPPDCTQNPYSAGNICDDAIPLCNLEVIEEYPCSQNPSAFGPWLNQAHCNGVYHNTDFYKFVAGTGSYNIKFTIFACAGAGVQYGIMEECSPGGPFVECNGGANTGTVIVPAESLTPCKTYIFWIDGFSGSICSYYVEVEGEFEECEIPPITDIEIPFSCDPLCPSFDPLTVNAIGEGIDEINGVEYWWDISGPGIQLNDLQTDNLSIDLPFIQPGTYEICLRTYHPCPGFSEPFCKEFVFENLKDPYKEFKICTSDFPWEGAVDEDGEPLLDEHGNQWAWIGGPITLAQVRGGRYDYASPLFNECGCSYTQYIRITEVTTGTGKDSFALCPNQLPFNYNGLTIEGDLTNYLHPLEGVKTKNGCDSLVNINVRILNMGGTISDDCVQGGYELKFNMSLQYINSARDSIKFVWKDAAGNIIKDNDKDSTTIVVPNLGPYTCEVTQWKYGDACTYKSMPYTVNLNGRLPLAPLSDMWPLKICENANVATYSVFTPDPNLTYIWTIPPTATKVSETASSITVRWNGPTGGNICVRAKNLCGEGPNHCEPVVFIDQMPPSFTMAPEICKDGETPIVATSTHVANTVYNWNFAGGNPSNTNGTGPGPHNVSWNSAGTKTVSLSVTEEGCTGDPVIKDIVVKDPPPPPIISCTNSTINSVTFEWPPVPGATSYSVAIVSGTGTGSLTGPTQYTVTNMALGSTVEVVLTAIIPGPCGNAVSLPVACTANNCVLPSIVIAPITPICLTATTQPIQLTNASVTITPATQGVGTFSINGVPSANGIFDPKTLGPGTHTIGYTLVFDNGLCRQSAPPIQVVVNPTPTSDFTVSPSTTCVLNPVTVTYTGGTTGAVYNWNFGADVIGSYNGPGPHNVKWSAAGVKTITLTVSKDGCTSPVTTKQVTLNPVLAQPVVSCVSQRKDAVTFGWAAVANASGYEVYINGVLIGTQTTTTYAVTGMNENDIATIKVVAVSSNGCPNTEDSQDCQATACPPIKLTFPKDILDPVCLTTSSAVVPLVNPTASPAPVGIPVFTWSGKGVNNTNRTFDPKIAGVGQHKIYVDYEDDGCKGRDSILIDVKLTPIASFTSEDKLCVSDILTVTYTGTPGAILTWDNGGATRQDLTQSTFGFKWAAGGTYTIGLTTKLDICTSTPFTKQVIVEDIPSPPVITCQEFQDKVVFSWNKIGCADDYIVKINGVDKGKQTATTYTASNLMLGEVVEIKVQAVSKCECPIAEAELMCKSKECPKVKITLAASPLDICLYNNAPKVKINATVTGFTADGKGTWSGTGVDQNGEFNPATAGVGQHVITYTWLDDNCTFTEKVTFNVYDVPKIVWEAVQPDCYNETSGSFIFQIQGGNSPYSLLMDGKSVSGSPVNGVTAGNHVFTVTDSKGCSSTQQFAITIPARPTFEIKGPPIVNLGKSATHTLDLSGMAGINIDSVVWTRAGVRICGGPLANCLSVSNIPPFGQNEYQVTIYYNKGCSVSNRFPYLVTDLYITTFPNIIRLDSKNGNNIFKITTSDPSLYVNKMRIYDRWGNLVFVASNFSAFDNPEGWNGKFDGKDVVPGVFTYVFEMKSEDNDEIIESGDLTVIK
ncbi:MAG: gliding motility-associated C-terminal domain-containing protein [Saprospiraceae bacterium]|nr:gliding motility-associated C-terminal domain-containing protein [Saprospiraceae bacterium]